jgi:polysaccharide biosynthesis/export protein
MKPSGPTSAVIGACCMSLLTVAALLSASARIAAQAPAQGPAQPQAVQPAPATKGTLTPADLGGVDTPPDYVIGPDDLLSIVFWREKDMSAEVAVRPDGMISLPLVNDVKAAGLTPEQLRVKVSEAASRFVEEPTVTVVVKAVNSRKVFITGSVGKIGAYALGGSTTVLQLIATAGGLLEYADAKKIMIVRTENGRQVTLRFNYKDVVTGKNLRQNVDLKPGDTVIVP